MFLDEFERWTRIFKSKDGGDVQAAKWLIAEYYDSLGHLSADGLQTLTRLLKENCTFFPSIKECLDLMRPASRYDWGHPFLGKPERLYIAAPSRRAIAYTPQLEGPDA